MILSNSFITKISQALHVIQEHTEWKTKSITFQSNGWVLNVGGGSTNRIHISLSSNMSFQFVSQTELNNLNSEIVNLKVQYMLTQLIKCAWFFNFITY